MVLILSSAFYYEPLLIFKWVTPMNKRILDLTRYNEQEWCSVLDVVKIDCRMRNMKENGKRMQKCYDRELGTEHQLF